MLELSIKIKSYLESIKKEYKENSSKELTLSSIIVAYSMLVFMYVLFPREPEYDLLRNLKGYIHNYNHDDIFAYATWTKFDPYYFFDVFCGFFHQHIGYYSYIPIQIICLLMTGLGIFLMLRGCNKNLIFLLLLVFYYFEKGRYAEARPAMFESALLFIAIGLRDVKNRYMHIGIGIIMASFYHMFWVYLFPLIIIRRVYIIPFVLGIAGWLFYGRMDYIMFNYNNIVVYKTMRLVPVSELQPIIYMFLGLAVFCIPFIYYYKKDIKLAIIIGYFSISNQIRYFDTVSGLLLAYAKNMTFKPTLKILIPVYLMVLFSHKPSSNFAKDFQFKIEDGAKVITENYSTLFKLAYAYDNIKITPTIEIALLPIDLQQIVVDIRKGKFDCEAIKKYPHDYVIERSFKQLPSACLELVGFNGENRVWKIKKNL